MTRGIPASGGQSRALRLGEPGPSRRLAAFTSLVVLVAVVAAGCLPTPETDAAVGAGQLYLVFMAIAAVVAAIVWGLATWMLVAHFRRRRHPPDGEPPQFRGSNLLEITWTAIPALTVLGLFALTVLAVDRIDAVVPSPAARLEVTAFRWGWRVDYPDAGVEVTGAGIPGPDIAVPIGQPVQFTLRSNDVIHSFFVPQFLFKRDAIPSHTTVFDFTVQAAGTYRGQCAEFCGIGHSQMSFSIVAMPADQFQAWLAEQRASGAVPGASTPTPGAGGSPGARIAPAPSGASETPSAGSSPPPSLTASPSSLASPPVPSSSPSSGEVLQ